MGRKGIQLTIALVIIAGGLITLAGVSFQKNLVYYLSVTEFRDQIDKPGTKDLRVNGTVVEGSVVHASKHLEVSFVITDGTSTMPVSYAKELPDTFKEGAEVVIEGASREDGVFEANTLLAKCPSKYEKEGDEHPEEIPLGSDQQTDPTL
jgi:cytochrome c-type biogenesis protein CcmE